MKRIYLLLVVCGALLASAVAWADEEMAPYPYVTASEMGRYYFKMVPTPQDEIPDNQDDHVPAFWGVCYRVEATGPDTKLWSVYDWYAFKTYLSMDGQYLVRLGNWPRGHEPSDDDLAVAFYKNGVLLKSYSTKALIKDVTAVMPTVSHYSFYTSAPTFESFYDAGTFTLTTVDHLVYTFDISTGEITRTEAQPKATEAPAPPDDLMQQLIDQLAKQWIETWQPHQPGMTNAQEPYIIID